ncbi:uncharacterized protein LOC109541260 isoform X2 [Dendroctonus ponderosae]|nr:uncharacterized protein LOC109541260 isoform X2 [Dendroctonus ponderosae]
MNSPMSSKQNKVLQSLEYYERKRIESKKERSFSIETEHGDVVTCKHESEINIIPKGHKPELNRVSFINTLESSRDDKNRDAEVQPNVRDLMKNLTSKRIEISSKGRDQISMLLKQIQKLKTGLQRLQEIATQFNCSERFNEDINYLINAKPLLQKQSRTDDVLNENMSRKM